MELLGQRNGFRRSSRAFAGSGRQLRRIVAHLCSCPPPARRRWMAPSMVSGIGTGCQQARRAVGGEVEQVHAPHAVALLEDRKRPLHRRPHLGDQPVCRACGEAAVQGDACWPAASGLDEPLVPCVGVIGLVAISRLLVAADQRVGRLGVGDRGNAPAGTWRRPRCRA